MLRLISSRQAFHYKNLGSLKEKLLFLMLNVFFCLFCIAEDGRIFLPRFECGTWALQG